MYIMALNCGSSSLKYQIYDINAKTVIIGGNVEKIGAPDSFATQKHPDGHKDKKETSIQNHNEALNVVMFMLREASIDIDQIGAVGHRVLHGGEKYNCSVEITDDVIKTIDELSILGPLHNPANLMGIVAAKQLLPNAKQVAVFDTAFHQTMPDFSYRYAVPVAWYRELGVRKYGFHGTSHLYVSKRAARMLGKPAQDCNLISMHIGSGASACAIKNGVSIDTSMGMTPLSGLTMGTRPGDIDPGVVLYVMGRLGLSVDKMQTHLNKASGHLGITECYTDRRELEENRERNDFCALALKMEANNAKKYIGGYLAELGHADALVFTAGVGENDNYLRAKMCEGLENLGIKLDNDLNDKALARLGAGEMIISAPTSKIKIMMIPTNEEIVIIEDTIAIMNGTYKPNHLEMKYSFSE
ncbi:MAG: acetate kinase [Rickettsiales bacterium]|jgi:acetate kinase|nr:acetate kinase [Rickettsiales bacterium]